MSESGWPVRTDRLLLRPAERADLEQLYRISTDPVVARMLFVFRPQMPFADFSAHFPLRAAHPPFRLTVEQDGRVVGSIGAGQGPRPSIFYFLSPEFAGRGLGQEMVLGFVALMERRFAPQALTAEVFADNPASLKILERAGFRQTGETMLTSSARAVPAPGFALERPGGISGGAV